MKIKDGDWTLFDYDIKTGRQVWVIHNADGTSTWRTDYPVQPTIDINQAQRNLAQENWKGDYHHVASIPLNVYYDQLAEASRQNDEKYVSKWLNDSDNRAWRTKNGNV
ncbi:MAG TPA: hypothetical protein VLA51_04235 [Paracoccaceae bacterium]|nr:hypothetical protein [Paracoccaceae bacterium]